MHYAALLGSGKTCGTEAFFGGVSQHHAESHPTGYVQQTLKTIADPIEGNTNPVNITNWPYAAEKAAQKLFAQKSLQRPGSYQLLKLCPPEIVDGESTGRAAPFISDNSSNRICDQIGYRHEVVLTKPRQAPLTANSHPIDRIN